MCLDYGGLRPSARICFTDIAPLRHIMLSWDGVDVAHIKKHTMCSNLEAGWHESQAAARQGAKYWRQQYEECKEDLQIFCQVLVIDV